MPKKEGEPGSAPQPGQEPPQPSPQPVAADPSKRLTEMEEENKRLRAELETVKETYQRTEDMLQGLLRGQGQGPGGSTASPQAQPAPARDWTQYGLSNEAAQAIVEEAEQRGIRAGEARFAQMQQQERLRAQFYESNPDLKGHEPLVAGVSAQVQQEHPDWRLDRAFAEVAKRAREYLARVGASHASSQVPPTPPGVLPSNSGAQPPAVPPSEPELTPDQEVQKDLDERRKRKVGALRGAY